MRSSAARWPAPASTCSIRSRRRTGAWPTLPQVVATPHIAASTKEAQEQVGEETAAAVRDFLKEGIIRNAVNFPSVSHGGIQAAAAVSARCAKQLGSVVAQMGEARIHGVGVRYYGELAAEHNQLLGSAVLEGVFCAILSSGGVTPVNARAIAAERGIELVESRSTRPRNYTSLISVKLHTSDGERWVEGTVFDNGSLRLVLVDGVAVEAPLEGHAADHLRTPISPASSAMWARCLAAITSTSRASRWGATRECADCAIGVVNVDEHPAPDHGGHR